MQYRNRLSVSIAFFAAAVAGLFVHARAAEPERATREQRLLYVAEPGIRNYLEYGGHGVLVYDIDHGHKFVRRIPAAGSGQGGQAAQREGRLRQRADRPALRQHHADADLPSTW